MAAFGKVCCSKKEVESMSVEEVRELLDEYMDEEAISLAFASKPGPDCCKLLKSVASVKSASVKLFSNTQSSSSDCSINENITDPFPIPMFHSSTQRNLDNKCFTEEDCLYMVRTIAMMLRSFSTWPKVKDCEIPARKRPCPDNDATTTSKKKAVVLSHHLCPPLEESPDFVPAVEDSSPLSTSSTEQDEVGLWKKCFNQ
uniref:Uncharacterized protein n=1 Tax=Amphimedon queenslandica TaxID=400682 RepID=A0A1X7V2N8_AMPQE